MSEHTLPDDFSRWPANPFLLLGVEPGVSDRDLRRAYTRLIRIYKPEHFPEHFRRIRAAYEAARDDAPYYRSNEESADWPSSPAESEPARPPELQPHEPGEPSSPATPRPLFIPRPPSFEEELDEAWTWAVEGDEAKAYARLLELHDRYPARSETSIRLYGLLCAAGELDPGRSPCDFLAEGLRQTGGSGPCHELYHREIEDNPSEALTERFDKLLRATTQPGLLVTFVQWRWRAASSLERFDIIGGDIAGLRARLAADQDETWLRLLAFAADQLAWGPASTHSFDFSDCLQEMALYQHLQLPCAGVFDRLECLERIALGWHSLKKEGQVPAALLQVLSVFWMRLFSQVRRGVMALLAAVANDTAGWLACLDRVNEVSPQLLSLFGEVLDWYRSTLDSDLDERDPTELTELAQYFLEEHGGLRYPMLRQRLLAFCLREMIPPEVIAEVALHETVVLPEARLNKLVNDWPLRHLYQAWTLFQT